VSATVKPGRNDACPCGSGRKYKHCHGTPEAERAAAPDHGRELTTLVRMLHSGALDAVEQRCRALLETRPLDGMLWKILSVALLRQGRSALPALARAVELLPRDAETHLNLGIALGAIGKRADAVSSYRQSLALNPAGIEALNNLGNVLRELGERREALPLYSQAVQLDPPPSSAAFETLLFSGAINEDAAHGLGSSSEEVAAAVPVLDRLDVHQPQIRLVNQRRGLERLARLLLGEALRRQLAQLVVDQR